MEPEVLLCDEPTASLDVSVQAQIVNLLMELKRSRQLSTVFVSHDLDLVHRVADDTVVMYAGRVVEAGSAEAIRRRPRHPYTQALLSAVPGDHPRRRKLEVTTRPEVTAEVDRTGAYSPRDALRVQDLCRTTPPPLEASAADPSSHASTLWSTRPPGAQSGAHPVPAGAPPK